MTDKALIDHQTASMRWTRGAAMDNWARFGLAARFLKAFSNASVFLFLLLPLVVLSNCAGTLATFTGYEALQGTEVPTDFVQPTIYLTYGSDWWVLGVMVFAAAGLGSAWRGGIPRSLIGLATAIGGLIALDGSISFFNPPTGLQSWSPNADSGGSAVGLAFASVIVFELASIATRSWYEVRRGGRQSPHVGDWTALGCGAAGFLILIALAILGLVALALFLRA